VTSDAGALPAGLIGRSFWIARSPVEPVGAVASAVCIATASFFAPRPVRRDQKPGDLLSPQKDTATMVTSRKTRAMTP
jgi:hypothetical protein